jgi:hypothetical protein
MQLFGKHFKISMSLENILSPSFLKSLHSRILFLLMVRGTTVLFLLSPSLILGSLPLQGQSDSKFEPENAETEVFPKNSAIAPVAEVFPKQIKNLESEQDDDKYSRRGYEGSSGDFGREGTNVWLVDQSDDMKNESVIAEGPTDEEKNQTPNCTPQELDVWRGKMDFSRDLSRMAKAGLGLPVLVRPKLIEAWNGKLSEDCVECFVVNVFCGATKCPLVCARSSFSKECLECVDRECVPALRKCIGAINGDDMPPIPPEEEVQSTTPAPIRTRKVKVKTESPVDVQLTAVSEVTAASEVKEISQGETAQSMEVTSLRGDSFQAEVRDEVPTSGEEPTQGVQVLVEHPRSFVVTSPQAILGVGSFLMVLFAILFGRLGSNH